jgi:CheY-like chemotaxis protein
MDLALPQLDGWAATRQLKARVRTHHIPVLAFTAHVLPDDLARARAAGCSAVIAKPFDITLFLATIDRLLQAPRERSVGS